MKTLKAEAIDGTIQMGMEEREREREGGEEGQVKTIFPALAVFTRSPTA